jgi:hypothetical protein
MIKEFTFSGFIESSWLSDFETVKLVDGYKRIDLVKKFRAIFDLYESEVSVGYYISDEKKTEQEIKEGWLKKLFGSIDADFTSESYNYSSYTYGTYNDSYLSIGGHDLLTELKSYKEKYCVIKISVKTDQ